MILKFTKKTLGIMMLSLLASKSMAVEYMFLSSLEPFQALVQGVNPLGSDHSIMSVAREESPSSVIIGVNPSDEDIMVQSFPPHANNGRLTTVRAVFSENLQREEDVYRFAYDMRMNSLFQLSQQFTAVQDLLTIENITTPRAISFTQAVLSVANYSPRLMASQLALREMMELEVAYQRARDRLYNTYMYSHIEQSSIAAVTLWVWNQASNSWQRELSYTVPSGVVTQNPIVTAMNPIDNQPALGSIGFDVSLPQIPGLGEFLDDLEQPQQQILTTCTHPYSSDSRVIRSLSELFPCTAYSKDHFSYFISKLAVLANSTFFF